jgi:nitrate reductase NapAB chaperone NapD
MGLAIHICSVVVIGPTDRVNSVASMLAHALDALQIERDSEAEGTESHG